MASDIAALEASSYRTWTADESDVVAGWHVTATAGLSRRVNSARDLGAAIVDDGALAALEAWFAARDLPLVVRETPIMSSSTGKAVRELWGFDAIDETSVMAASATQSAVGGVRVVSSDDDDFQAELYALNGRTDGNAVTLYRIYSRIVDRAAGVWMPGQGAAVVVQDGGRCAVFSLAVADSQRRQGIGTRLMAAASTWAGERGVSEMFVQVAGTNSPAIELYRSLGFEEVYRYRYLDSPG
jgi:ribosomal protein S18 acetylase RimI-like enzyme